jgi:hypothetical protein
MPLPQYPSGLVNVFVYLDYQCIDTGEPSLIAQPVLEAHTKLLAVEIAVESKQMNLDGQGFPAEGRSHADIHHTGHEDIPHPHLRRIHAAGRHRHLFREGEIGSREANRPPPPITRHDYTAQLEGPAQGSFGALGITFMEQRTNRRRRNRRTVTPEQLERVNLETVPGPLPLQGSHIPGPVAAEPEVGADNDQFDSQGAEQNLVNELSGMHLAYLLEGKYTYEVNVERFQNL